MWAPLPVSSIAKYTSSNGNIFRVTGHLWGEFIGDLRRHLAHYDVTVMWVDGRHIAVYVNNQPQKSLDFSWKWRYESSAN